MRKINQYRTTYYKEIAASVTLLFVAFMTVAHSHASTADERTYIREETPITVEVTVTETLSDKDVIVAKIRAHFPRNADVMVAIAQAESHLNPEAIGYNCFYNKDETTVYTTRVSGSHSTHCKPSHRAFAWSIDCGILQRNYVGAKTCPDITIDEHLEDVANLSRKQGLTAWSSYNNNSYKKYLANN